MTCQVHIYLLNDHFSIEHAEAHYNGEESEMNRKYEWEDELEIKGEVEEVLMNENEKYPLQGTLPDGNTFNYNVEKMRIFEVKVQNGESAYLGCSESILDSYTLNKTATHFILNIYLKDFEPMSNPIPGIYIASKEFPKELIF